MIKFKQGIRNDLFFKSSCAVIEDGYSLNVLPIIILNPSSYRKPYFQPFN